MSGTFRRDIEGLRALAVIVVVLYHAGVPGFSGGYVGVDVFFVISGFLITRLLVQEIESTGAIDLREFIARRARRLLPLSIVVILAVIALASLLRPPLEVVELRSDALAASLYVANIRFAIDATDYLREYVTASPFQHYWSLAVEEQFYLLWPVVLVGAARIGRRRGVAAVRAIAAVVAFTTVVSLAAAVLLTPRNQPMAFFLLPTRAWEMAAGGLVAVATRARESSAPSATRLSRLTSWTVAWGSADVFALACLAGIGVAVVTYGPQTAFPGLAAVLPVAATGVWLWTHHHHSTAAQRLLSGRPMMAVGRWSYGIYLWHWPLLLYAGGVPGGDLGAIGRAGVIIVSVLLAALTYRWVEQPVRHHAWLRARRRASLASAAVATILVAIVVVGVTSTTRLPVWEAPVSPVASDDGVGSLTLTFDGLIAVDGSPQALSPTAVPTLATARDSLPAVYGDGCHLRSGDVGLASCEYGILDAEMTVVLVGDSHGATWFPALESLAEARTFRLISHTKSSCGIVGGSPTDGNPPDSECREWQEEVGGRLASLAPDVVVTSNITNAVRSLDEVTAWERELAAFADVVTAMGAKLIIVGDVPYHEQDPLRCLSDHVTDVSVCATSVQEATQVEYANAERRIAEREDVAYVDPIEILCDDDVCPVATPQFIMNRDRHHLTAEFAQFLAPMLEEAIAEVLSE